MIAPTGVYEILPGFLAGGIAAIVVSLCTKAPSEDMLQEFEDVKNGNVAGI